MTRFIYVIIVSLPLLIYYLVKIRYVVAHEDRYSVRERYSIAQRMITLMNRNGRIKTEVYGTENLPDEGGYVMYPNHQGKYDVLSVILGHKEPCTYVIDEERSKLLIANEFTMLLKGTRLDKTDIRAQVKAIQDIIKKVKNGTRYIIFPEGGYTDNGNNLQEFMPGTFKCSIKSKTPIVPVALIDSHKVFGINSLKPVTTKVHFLKPLLYEEYKDLNSHQIADIVKSRIQAVME